jgi:hypothetical protein
MITTKQLIDEVFGGTTEAAKLLNVPKSTVSRWKKRGFPDSYDLMVRVQQEAARRGVVYDPRGDCDQIPSQTNDC